MVPPFLGEERRVSDRLAYEIRLHDTGWRVSANGADCGICSDRETATLSAIRWARRSSRLGLLISVLTVETDGTTIVEWCTGDPFPPLRVLAATMQRSSAYFVREWDDWRADLYIAR
jgi:hypothetical protein